MHTYLHYKMDRPKDEIISKAAYGDVVALAKIYEYLKEYSAKLSPVQKGHLDIEKNSIILKGMDYRMKKEQMKAWGKLIDEMIIQIKSGEITNLN